MTSNKKAGQSKRTGDLECFKVRKLIAVDFDQTLTNEGRFWKNEPILPNLNMVKWINEKYKQGHIIIIHTARPWSIAKETIAWLIKYDIRYHGVNFEKMSADIYVDDKAINVKDIK